MPEQAATARLMQELGLGTSLDRQEISAEKPWTSVETAAGGAAMRLRIAQMQTNVRGAGGAPRAATALIECARA